MDSSHSTGIPSRFWTRAKVIKAILLIVLLTVMFNAGRLWQTTFHALAAQALQRNDPNAALDHLSWAEQFGRHSPETMLLKARCARRLGNPEDFHQYLQQAEQGGAAAISIQREKILFAAQSGQLTMALPHLSALLTDTSGDNKDVCFSYISGYLRNQRVTDAMVLLDAWVKDAPQDPLPWLIRGKVWKHSSDNAHAEEDLRQALTLQPDNAEAMVELGELMATTKRIPEARALFEQAMSDSAMRSRALLGLTDCMKSQGDPAAALSLLEQETQDSPDNTQAWLELGRTQFENGNFQAAEKALRKCLELRSWDDEAMYILSQCLNQMDQQEEATALANRVVETRKALSKLESLKDATRDDATNSQLLVQAGEIVLRYANPEDGVVTLQAALDNDPTNADAHRLLAEYYQSKADEKPRNAELAEWHRQQAEK